jgi:hypothetical protein
MENSVFNTVLQNIQNATLFTSTSLVALYRQIAQGVTITCDAIIAEIQSSIAIITNILGTQRYGTTFYYINIALAYQDGVPISINEMGQYYYTSINQNALIITKAAFQILSSGSYEVLILKVATTDTQTNSLIALTPDQLNAFVSYFNLYKIPGIVVNIISLNANILNFNAQIYYNASSDLTTIKSNIAASLTTFKNNFAFNGTFYETDISSYIIQNVQGVRSFYLTGTSIDGNSFTGSTILSSGYFEYATNITNTFTYISI